MAGKTCNTLEVDPTLLEKSLLLEDVKNDDLNSLISTLKVQQDKSPNDGHPWKLVKPSPGFLVKTHTESGEKIFLNICHTEEIVPPQDISDDQLLEIMQSDEASSFRLPMSIGDLHEEPDKSGALCSVYDIAINSNFFRKVESNQMFRYFLLSVTLEAVADKYNKKINVKEYTVLKNRRIMGTLQYHRIAQRGTAQKTKTLIEEMKSNELSSDIPRFRIIREPPQGKPELLTVQVHVKDAVSSKSLLLDVGEDRIVLRSTKKTGSLLDIFLPYSIDQDSTCAHFDQENQILSVELPVLS